MEAHFEKIWDYSEVDFYFVAPLIIAEIDDEDFEDEDH